MRSLTPVNLPLTPILSAGFKLHLTRISDFIFATRRAELQVNVIRSPGWFQRELHGHIFGGSVAASGRIHWLDHVKHRIGRGSRRRKSVKLDLIGLAARIPSIDPDCDSSGRDSSEEVFFQSGKRICL